MRITSIKKGQNSPPEVRKWMHENVDLWKEKPE